MSSKLFHPKLQQNAQLLAKDLQSYLRLNPQNPKKNNLNQVDVCKLTQLFEAVDGTNRSHLNDTLKGIEAYRAHPYQRDVSDPDVIWVQGSSRLLDYGDDAQPNAKPVLFIPSLVNRAYILDLMADCSLLRWLSKQGLHPYLLDWGAPDAAEVGFGLEGYISRLVEGFDHIHQIHQQPVGLAGYCMGGLLALALGLQRQKYVPNLALMATPWDFHQPDGGHAKSFEAYVQSIDPILKSSGQLPTDMLQSLFTGLDPVLVLKKFSKFSTYPQNSHKTRLFVALEDWLNDGVPLEADVARDCLIGWYGENKPAKGIWQIAKQRIIPANFTTPTLVIIPTGDKIVPLLSAKALSDALPNTQLLHPPLGHIGMVVGKGAQEMVWQKLASFLGGRKNS